MCLSQAEWEALEIVEHEWTVDGIEEELMDEFSPSDLLTLEKDKYA